MPPVTQSHTSVQLHVGKGQPRRFSLDDFVILFNAMQSAHQHIGVGGSQRVTRHVAHKALSVQVKVLAQASH